MFDILEPFLDKAGYRYVRCASRSVSSLALKAHQAVIREQTTAA